MYFYGQIALISSCIAIISLGMYGFAPLSISGSGDCLDGIFTSELYYDGF